jgi:hypothetical protein
LQSDWPADINCKGEVQVGGTADSLLVGAFDTCGAMDLGRQANAPRCNRDHLGGHRSETRHFQVIPAIFAAISNRVQRMAPARRQVALDHRLREQAWGQSGELVAPAWTGRRDMMHLDLPMNETDAAGYAAAERRASGEARATNVAASDAKRAKGGKDNRLDRIECDRRLPH